MFSALPSNSDIARRSRHFAFVPEADYGERSFTEIVEVANKFAVNDMAPDRKRGFRSDLAFAIMLVAVGLAISGISLAQIYASKPTQMAQATQPLQPSPPETQNKPAESKPGGERPTTPAPEPARPDAQAQKAGAQPVLPPAPAEKTAAPIQQK
jgi:hypothetical protein